MVESSWNECLEKNTAFEKSKDANKAESLKATAIGRISFIEKQEINEENANYVFENYYSSITELIHSIAALKGFKILNHLCLGFFLREVMKQERLSRLFDDLRFKRNSLLYYGRKMDFETAKDAIEKSYLFSSSTEVCG